MTALTLYAGASAYARIREEGLHPDQFEVMLGASGGPKWFVLYELDRYLFGDFFSPRNRPLYTLGSSAGAWRMACLGMNQPVAAIERLAELYSHERYSSAPTIAEITRKAEDMLKAVLGPTGLDEIIANPVFKTHIIADRCRGFGSSRRRLPKMLFLALAATLNAVSRRSLSLFFERTLFTPLGAGSPWSDLHDLETRIVTMNRDNAFDALIASGSIPFVLEGVRDIAGAGKGLFWDGGITDYHFDFPFHDGPGLVLYPHFSPAVIPGWFDKHVPWRRIHEQHFHNVVLLAPSDEFVATLPAGKISDRKDFQRYDADRRIRNWQEVLQRSSALAEDFARLVEDGHNLDRVQPLHARQG